MGKGNPTKYALVLWTTDSSWSIIESKHISNPLMLYDQSLIENLPYFKNASDKVEDCQLYPGRVLRLHGKKKELESQAGDFIDNFLEEEEGRKKKNKNKIPPKSTEPQPGGSRGATAQPSLSDMDDEELRETVHQPANTKRPRSDSSKIAVQEEEEKRSMEKRIHQLEGQLKNQVDLNTKLQQELPSTIKATIQSAMESFFSSAPSGGKLSRGKSRVSLGANGASNHLDSEEIAALREKMEKFASKSKINEALRGSTHSIIVANLLVTLFTITELTTSTVSGLKTEKPNKLDEERLQLIRDFASAYMGLSYAETNYYVGVKLRNVCATIIGKETEKGKTPNSGKKEEHQVKKRASNSKKTSSESDDE